MICGTFDSLLYTSWRAIKAEEVLQGKVIDEKVAAEAADAVIKESKPLKTVISSSLSRLPLSDVTKLIRVIDRYYTPKTIFI